MSRRPLRETPAAIIPDGGLVVVAPDGTVLRGNRTAAALWTAMQHGADHDEAAAIVARQYRAPESMVRADLNRMTSILDAAGVHLGSQL